MSKINGTTILKTKNPIFDFNQTIIQLIVIKIKTILNNY